MRNFLVCIVLLLTIFQTSFGQAYKYIGVTEGLSDRRVLSIQKDKAGFMWFLTYTGIDRYDGKNIKHYRLLSEEGYISFYSEKNILKVDAQGNIWTIDSKGSLFKYHPTTDKFIQIQLPQEITTSLELVEMTDFNEIWYCKKGSCYIYNIHTGNLQYIELDHKHKHITAIYQKDEKTYYLGSDDGICQTTIKDGKLISTQCIISSDLCKLPHIIYIHPSANRLFAGSETNGLLVYDLTIGRVEKQFTYLKDFPITGFHLYHEKQLLIPTRGAGIFRYNLQDEELNQYIHADFDEPNKMNGNNIRSLFIDNQQRLWMSVYARGVTVYDETLPSYKWYKNNQGNQFSLNDDLVNAIMEDSDGDIWFATNNGLSIYNPTQNSWKHLFEWKISESNAINSSIFLSLCEIEPGTIVAGGFMTGVYAIDKKTMQTRLVTPLSYKLLTENPSDINKYIRVIYRDEDGLIWTGGNKYLGCTNKKDGSFKHYSIGNAITCIQEMDSTILLIGTGNGMYRLNKRTQQIAQMRMPFSSQQINAIYRHSNGDLYIGTTNSGLVILRNNGEYEQYLQATSALLSNTINSIVPKNDTEIILATEQNIALFNCRTKKLTNWTEDHGLIRANFNPRAGIHTSRNTFIFGGNIGAIEWSDSMRLPHKQNPPIFFDQIQIESQHSTSETTNPINIQDQDSINELILSHKQNVISLHISTIDYYTPQFSYFRWKLDGKYNYWNKFGKDNWIQLRNLAPGEYTLHIQHIASEDHKVTNERKLKIIVKPTFWQSVWALLLYFMGITLLFAAIIRYFWMKKKQKDTDEKDRFMIDTVNSIRTPLTLVKSAMNEVMQQETLSPQSYNYLQTAGYSIEKLSMMTINLLNIDKMQKKQVVHVEQYDINQLIRKYTKPFTSLAEHNNIGIQFITPEDNELLTWIDPSKIELIYYNLISNLIRQTTSGRNIYISVHKDNKRWGVEVSNSHELTLSTTQTSPSGHTIRHTDEKQLFTELHLIKQLVKRHRGKLRYSAIPPSNYLFSITFPVKDSHYVKQKSSATSSDEKSVMSILLPLATRPIPMEMRENTLRKKHGYILLIHENNEILEFLNNSLCKEWRVSSARSTSIALALINEHEPDIIIASSSIPTYGENDLCSILKSNIDTSHIPIILITSDDDKESIRNSFMQRADHYVTNPNDLFVIQSVLNNILENRQQLQERLSRTDQIHKLKELKHVNVEQDTKFLTEIEEAIQAHIDDPNFGVDELCTLMSMSRTNLYNKTKSLTNQSLSALIRDARMKRAGEMLLSGKYNIAEVCDRLGFSETKYFREVFKKFYGTTPSDYVKEHKNQIKED